MRTINVEVCGYESSVLTVLETARTTELVPDLDDRRLVKLVDVLLIVCAAGVEVDGGVGMLGCSKIGGTVDGEGLVEVFGFCYTSKFNI